MLFLLSLCCTALAFEVLQYEGLRVDMSALTLNRDILASIIPALNRTLNHTFKPISESGSLGAELSLTNIKITKPVINENLLNMPSYEFDHPIYRLKGNDKSILFHLSFDYSLTWILPIAFGKGTGIVTNQAKEILVFFNETEPDVQLPHPWGIVDIMIGWNPFLSATWVTSLLQKTFITEFHKVVDDSMHDFAHQLLKPYTRIEDVFNQTIDLVFNNILLAAFPSIPGFHFTIGFDSNVTVNQFFARNLYRRLRVTTLVQTDFVYCFAAQLVPDVIDVLGKVGYYDMEVPYIHWNFQDSTVKQLFEILPELKGKYTGNELFSISCQLSRSESVNDLGKRTGFDMLKLLYPIYCMIMIPDAGDCPLMVDIFYHLYYSLMDKNRAFIGHANEVIIQNFKPFPELSTTSRSLLREHLSFFSMALSDKELLSPGLRVDPKRMSELEFNRYEFYLEEICYYYSEKRPVTPFVNDTSTA